MKEGPSGSAIKSLVPNHRKLLRSKAEVVRLRKSRDKIPAGMVEREARSRNRNLVGLNAGGGGPLWIFSGVPLGG